MPTTFIPGVQTRIVTPQFALNLHIETLYDMRVSYFMCVKMHQFAKQNQKTFSTKYNQGRRSLIQCDD